MLRMQKCPLALAEIAEAEFVDCTVTQSPGMAEVDLLNALLSAGSESRDIGATGFEFGESIKGRVLSEVVISAELLLGIDPVVQAHSELVRVIATDGNSGERTIRKVTVWYETQ